MVSGTGTLTENGTGTLTLTGSNTYTGATIITTGALQLGAGGSTGSLATTSALTNNGTFIINRNNAVTQGTDFSGASLTGTGSFIQAGTGTTTLNASNSYTGGTALNAGVLALGNSNAIGTSGTISFGGGQLQFSSSNTNDYSARFSTAAAQAYSFDVAGQTVSLGTALTSSGGSLTLTNSTGAGTLTLSKANTYSGATTVNGGTLAAGTNNAIGSSSAVNINGGTLSLGSFNDSVGAVTLGSGSITGTGTLTGASYSVTNGLISAHLGGSGALTQSGNGTTTLSGTNSYTGTTTVNSGTLAVGINNAIGSSSAVNVNGGTLSLGSFNDSVGAVTLGSGSITGTGTLTGTSYSVTNGLISTLLGGSGALTQNGSGTTTLSGANTYSGGTVVSAGQLDLGSASALGTGGVSVTGGTLDLGANTITNTLAPFASGTIQDGTISNNGGNYTVSGGTITAILAGNNGLNASGGTLGGANTFTGTTTITSAGTLVLSTAGSLASTNINLGTSGSRGTLDLTAKTSGYTNGTTQTLTGYGTVNIGSGTLTENGNLAPSSVGSSGNKISVAGNLALGSASATTLQIQGTNSYDTINVTGNIVFNGNLFLNINGYTPVAGATFDLFSATSYAIGLTNVALTGSWFPGTFTETSTGIWNYTTNAESWTFTEANGQLAITAVPEPATYVLFGLGALVLIVVYRRKAGQR